MRKWMGAGCVLALMCACASPRMALGQASTADSKAGGAKSTTATPKKHAATAAKGSRASASSLAKSPTKSPTKAHPASHPAANKHSKTSTAAAAHSSKSKYASSRKVSKRKTARGQQKIEPERAQAIQEALIREHYMSGEAAGTWNQASEDAMRRYQADHGWQSKTVPDSRALISLGLGPSHDHLLNPESAMTTGPDVSHSPAANSESQSPASHSADPGARMNTAPVATAPTAPAPHDSPGPQ